MLVDKLPASTRAPTTGMSNRSATRKVIVLNPAGLHARPSLAVVQAVRGSQSKVEVRTSRQTADASDILQLLGLGAAQGTELVLSAAGPDAEEVLSHLAELFANGFGLCGKSD
jgi:phosphotransferase system HPr (HPr) family protein